MPAIRGVFADIALRGLEEQQSTEPEASDVWQLIQASLWQNEITAEKQTLSSSFETPKRAPEP